DDSGEVDAAVIDDPVEVDAAVIDDPVEVDAAGGSSARSPRDLPRDGPGLDDLSTAGLLVNVAASQGVFLGLLAVAVWYAGVPPSALGLAPGAEVPALSTSTATATSPLTAATSLDLAPALAVGAAFGVGLYALNEVGAAAGERLGLGSSEELRESLAPDSPGGWVVLLGVVLPIIAGFEELLFRGALVGALSVGAVQAGLDLGAATPWLFAVGSSVAFALGHGAQGRGGVVVTGLLGLTLAGAFVLTWSLPLVFVAHYLINALEFVVHEFLGVDWI
ncbi:MAG: lysostaphin resistance A-like protein, partial [Haloferacaceae archaeon]